MPPRKVRGADAAGAAGRPLLSALGSGAIQLLEGVSCCWHTRSSVSLSPVETAFSLLEQTASVSVFGTEDEQQMSPKSETRVVGLYCQNCALKHGKDSVD